MKPESKVPIATKNQFPSFSFLLISLHVVAAVVLTVTNLAFAEAATDPKIEYYLAKQDWDSLVKIGQPAIPRLVVALSDENERVRQGSIDALGRIGDRTAIESLVAVLKDYGPYPSRRRRGDTTRAHAADALVKLGYSPKNADDKIALWFASVNWQGILPEYFPSSGDKAIINDLKSIGPEAVLPLCKILRKLKANGEEDYREAACAATVLGIIGSTNAVGTLIAVADCNDHVDSGYSNVADDYPVTEAAVKALGEIRDPNAVDPLIKLLQHTTNNDVWRACAQALAELGDARAAVPLGELLNKPFSRAEYDSDYRPAVCNALGRLGAASVEPLITALKNSDAQTREMASEALGKIGDKRAVQPLCKLLKDEKPEVRRAVVNALGQLKDKQVIDSLIGAIKDTDPKVRRAVVNVLGQLKDKQAIDPLIGALKDTDSDVRADAAKALDELGWKP